MKTETIKTYIYDPTLMDMVISGAITPDEYMERAEEGPALDITTLEEEMAEGDMLAQEQECDGDAPTLDTLLHEVNVSISRLRGLYHTAIAMKARDPNHHNLTHAREMWKQELRVCWGHAVHAVHLYAPHCKKCGGKGYFPQYAHVNEGKCFSCNNPTLSLNVIFKDMDLTVAGKVWF